MIKLLVLGLDALARLCYFASHTRNFRTGLFVACAFAFGTIAWARSARSEDTTIYPLPPAAIRATLVNRYVNASGKLVTDGAYEVKSPLAGLFWQTLRFIPLMIQGAQEPLSVLDENLPPHAINGASVIFVGKLLAGQPQQPDYYLRVMDPPSKAPYDITGAICTIFLLGVVVGLGINWFVRRADYAIAMPLGLAQGNEKQESTIPSLFWFGGLGPGYGDVVLRQVPVSFRAIPAEAKLTPTYSPDLWSVLIRRPRLVQYTTIATSYGALPAVRLEFEDERGITRNGLVAASHRHLIDSILDVLRFVGQ